MFEPKILHADIHCTVSACWGAGRRRKAPLPAFGVRRCARTANAAGGLGLLARALGSRIFGKRVVGSLPGPAQSKLPPGRLRGARPASVARAFQDTRRHDSQMEKLFGLATFSGLERRKDAGGRVISRWSYHRGNVPIQVPWPPRLITVVMREVITRAQKGASARIYRSTLRATRWRRLPVTPLARVSRSPHISNDRARRRWGALRPG